MKILALGALWVPYIRENWFDAIRHVLGPQATCVNAGPLIANKERFSAQPEGYHSAYVYDMLRRERFDYLFFYHDWIFGDYPDAFFDKVRKAGVRTVAFHPDDEPEHWYARNAAFDHHFDVIASHSTAGVARRHAAGWGERALYLPWGYNPRSCYAIEHAEKRYDVVFIGKHKVSTAHDQAHVEDGAQREQILVHLAEVCEQRGWTFRVFGFGWDKHPQLARFAGGIPSQEGMVRILNESRVVFNPAWSSDGNPNAVQTKLRHFEVPGCGAFQITNDNSELAQLFEPDNEIVFYSSEADLLDKVARYVSDERSRGAIAAAGHARALLEHTLDHRVETLFAHMRKLHPAPASTHHPSAVVKRVDIPGLSSLAQLRQQLISDPAQLDGIDWVHVVAGNFQQATTDYAALQPFFRSMPDVILTCSTFADFEGLAANPLQPQLIESYGCILSQDFNGDDFDFSLLDSEGGNFTGTRLEEKTSLLINYIAPRDRVIELLNAFIAGKLEGVHALHAVPTGRIVTEVLLQLPAGHELFRMGVRGSEYVRRLRALLPRFQKMKWKVAVYGISGMGEVTMKLLEQLPELAVIGIVDRSLQTTQFRGIPVVQPAALQALQPDVIILTAGASGPTIYASIAHLEGSCCILPLHDLNHPVWNVVLA